jgi:hypothetical protein
MNTDDLIRSLAADARRPVAPLSSVWWLATGAAIAVAAVVFMITLGPRPDFLAAIESPRFLFKFVFTIVLTVSAFGAARTFSRPGEAWRKVVPYLAAAPILMLAAVITELIVLPPETRWARLIGENIVPCLTSIPLIGIGPLAIFLLVLRHGAPTRPVLAGAVAGLLAGGIAATFYAAKCTDDSPLFVATWYTIAIAGLALFGAVGANRLVHW